MAVHLVMSGSLSLGEGMLLASGRWGGGGQPLLRKYTSGSKEMVTDPLESHSKRYGAAVFCF